MTSPPYQPEIRAGRLYGRGASDMKSGVAAFVMAAIEANRSGELAEDIVLILTAGEETGCEGAFDLVRRGVLPRLGALLVAEPTQNQPIIGHKGCLRVEVTVHGRAAHTAMPQLGENALEKAVKAITRILDIAAVPAHSDLLGPSTLTVSTMQAGTTINIVPDLARFSLCARTVPAESNMQLLERIHGCLDATAETRVILDLGGMETARDDAFVRMACDAIGRVTGHRPEGQVAPYGTDAAALTPGTGTPPTIVLGPGSIDVAHKPDEYCELTQIDDAHRIYRQLIADYGHA